MESSEQRSTSSGMSDESWLLIKNINENNNNIGINPESSNILKTTEEEHEDSDGISVISESEVFKQTASDNEMEKENLPVEVEKGGPDDVQEELSKEEELHIPPVTPLLQIKSEPSDSEYDTKSIQKYEEKESANENKGSKSHHTLLMFMAMTLIIVFLYTNINNLRNDFAMTISIYEQRIAHLEKENQVLKAQIEKIMIQFGAVEIVQPESSDNQKTPIYHDFDKENETPMQPIKMKTVWLGNERENVVKIIDKKYHSLPDYCYFTDENDLFYEYNQELCDRKRQKLDERVKKYQQMEKRNSEQASDKSYEDFMAKTTEDLLHSLSDEIQQIKNSRPKDDNIDVETNLNEALSGENDNKNTDAKLPEDTPPKEKPKRNKSKKLNDSEESSEKKKKKKQKSKRKSTGEWIENRSTGREQARINQDKEDDLNWYLKRKNEREINRLEKLHA